MSRYFSLFSPKTQPEDANKKQEEINKIQIQIDNFETELKINWDNIIDKKG